MPDTPDLGYAFSLEPEKAIAYFEQLGYRISWDWHDTMDEAFARAFTVAGVANLDVLKTIYNGVKLGLKSGQTEQWFIDNLTPLLQDAGWWGKQEVEVQPGETRIKQLGSPERLRLIYRQNTQSALMAGRYADFMANADAQPYWMYVAVMDEKTRPSHAAMNGRVFRYDDPIWQTHWPPCGWNCRCRVRALSQRDMDRKGLEADSSEGKLVNKMVDAGVDATTGEIIRTQVTGLKLIGKDGKPITFFPDAGFNFNQARAAWQPELDAYPPDIASQYVQGLLTGPEFERWFRIWQRTVDLAKKAAAAGGADATAAILDLARKSISGMEYPVAVLQDQERQALGASTQAVWLSDTSLLEHLVAHPEVGLDAYQLIPQLMAQGEIYMQGDQRIILLSLNGKLYRASIKVTKDGSRNYFLTLFTTTDEAADRQVRSRYERIK